MKQQGLFSVNQVVEMINRGDILLLAGDSPLLSSLPKGNWVGGVTNQFIETGKELITSREKIFVHNITDYVSEIKMKVYDVSNIHTVYDDAYDNGFSVLITPFHCDLKEEYALNCMNYSNFASRILCGWVSISPFYTGDKRDISIVFSGETGLSYDNAGVVMHVKLHEGKYAEIYTFNPYLPESGDVIIFEQNGNKADNVIINGIKQNFRKYMIDRKIDRSTKTNNVLVGDYAGIIINTVILPELEGSDEKHVFLGNPVFKGIPYKFAELNSAESYINMQQIESEIILSFTCATNFVFPEDFTKYLTHTNGPFVYGEFAYFLLNNTTLYLTVGDS